MAFGWLLDGFCNDFGPKLGGQNGAKLAPKSEKWGSQDDVKKSKAKRLRRLARVMRVRGGWVPINTQSRASRGSQWGIRHSTSSHKGTVADTVYSLIGHAVL